MKANTKTPVVSIITPTLNSEAYIADNIRSTTSQTYRSIEHVIVDGGSTDRTLSIVKELEPGARVSSEPDRGISDAFNKGLGMATGDIIAVLNSDDYYAHERVIERVVEVFNSRNDVKVVYGRVRCVEPDSGKTLVVYGKPYSPEKLKKEMITPHPAVFARREVYESVGPFSLEYKLCMDHDYFLRIAKLYESCFIDEIFTIMRWGGLSTSNIYLGHREAYRIMRSNGVNTISALANFFYRYAMTTLSLALQKIGLAGFVLFYRKKRGQL